MLSPFDPIIINEILEKTELTKQETMEQLQQYYKQLLAIPTHYSIAIEEVERNSEEREQYQFVWTNTGELIINGNPEQVAVLLELNEIGRIMEYSREGETALSSENTLPEMEEDKSQPALSEDEAYQIALTFIQQKTGYRCDEYQLTKVKNEEEKYYFYWQQEELQLPVPYSGYYVVVQHNKQISEFRYYGTKAVNLSDQPDQATSELYRYFAQFLIKQLDLNIEITNEQPRLKLAYFARFLIHGWRVDGSNWGEIMERIKLADADEEADIHDEDEASEVEEKQAKSYIDKIANFSLETMKQSERLQTVEQLQQFFAIDPENYELIRSSPINEHVEGLVWRKRHYISKRKQEKTFEHLLLDGIEETIKIKWNRKTKRVLGFISFEDDEVIKKDGHEGVGEVARNLWNVDKCLEVVKHTMQQLYTDLIPYLRLESIRENDGRYFFTFILEKKGHALSEQFSMAVHRCTGQIRMLMVPDITGADVEQLQTTPLYEVSDIADQLQSSITFVKQWQDDYAADHSERQYHLVYQPVARTRPEKELSGLIDAVTGEWLTYR
ncbi:YcdB/YcdC domain-containing protein [Paenibacillus yanchengensis]|uniref:YcdB/YcdC domain-containing protein n=1 Tax=Paenibacillus yanchengensis TaxID=2035833 RepID=A0ABW4YIS7_9BACL